MEVDSLELQKIMNHVFKKGMSFKIGKRINTIYCF